MSVPKGCFLVGWHRKGPDQTAHLQSDLEVIKNFMLNSAENEILNAHKYKILRNSTFSGSDMPRMLCFLLINVKMPTIVIVGILAFMSRKNFMLS